MKQYYKQRKYSSNEPMISEAYSFPRQCPSDVDITVLLQSYIPCFMAEKEKNQDGIVEFGLESARDMLSEQIN